MAMVVAISAALYGRVRVWVGPEARQSRSGRCWPPGIAPPLITRTNEADALLRGAWILSAFAMFMLTLILTVVSLERVIGRAPAPGYAILLAILVCGGVSLGVCHCVFVWIALRILANSPRDCWPEARPDSRTREEFS